MRALSTVVPFVLGSERSVFEQISSSDPSVGGPGPSSGFAVSKTIRLTFLALSIFGLAANFFGLVYTFAALVNVLLG
jgi:hypothetical protein